MQTSFSTIKLINQLRPLGVGTNGKIKCKLEIAGDTVRVHVYRKDLAEAAKLLKGLRDPEGRSYMPCYCASFHQAPGVQPTLDLGATVDGVAL